jgi:hypothetical protein
LKTLVITENGKLHTVNIHVAQGLKPGLGTNIDRLVKQQEPSACFGIPLGRFTPPGRPVKALFYDKC